MTSGNKEGGLEASLINDTLADKISLHVVDAKRVTLIHDPSELRKKHSKELEHLGQVCDLDKQVIAGYNSFNTVATIDDDESVHLLHHELYSNKQPEFIKADTIKQLDRGDLRGIDEDVEKRYYSGDYINKKTIAQACIKHASDTIKSSNPDAQVEHILDREFDDQDYFNWLNNELGDRCIIRLKVSRTMKSLDAHQPSDKLVDVAFSEQHTFCLPKVTLHQKLYQDMKLHVSWAAVDHGTVIKIILRDRHGKAVFNQPMLLLTNHPITDANQARAIYFSYLKRWRIECVFKFVKSALGWETFRLRDFEGIKTLVAIGFFIAAYLYEVGEESIQHAELAVLADIGGGKGVVTRHYIWEGIKRLLIKHQVDQTLERLKPDKQTIDNLERIAGISS